MQQTPVDLPRCSSRQGLPGRMPVPDVRWLHRDTGKDLWIFSSCSNAQEMTTRAVDEFGVDDFDLLFLENIGNLVCPAEFDTGAHKNMMILSVPEGDDKPLKYPLMFSVCDLVIISKIDTLDYFDFDIDQAKVNILNLNPNAKIICLSAKTGEGMNEFIQWIKENKNN